MFAAQNWCQWWYSRQYAVSQPSQIHPAWQMV